MYYALTINSKHIITGVHESGFTINLPSSAANSNLGQSADFGGTSFFLNLNIELYMATGSTVTLTIVTGQEPRRVGVHNAGQFVPCEVYVRADGAWVECVPHYRDNGAWVECDM